MSDKSEDQDEEIEIMQENIKDMKFQYLWPKKNSKYFHLKFYSSLALTVPSTYSVFLHFVGVIRNTDGLDDNINEDIANLSLLAGIYQMVISFVWYRKDVVVLWKALGTSKNFGKPDNFEKRRQQLNKLIKILNYYVYFAITCYLIVKLLDRKRCQRKNTEQNLNELCGVIPGRAPFGLDYAPYKQILFFCQFFTCCHVAKAMAAISLSIFEVSEYIVLKIKHLRRLLIEVFDDPDEEVKKRNLDFCVRYHQHILELHNLYNKVYRRCNGVYVVIGGIIFATGILNILKEPNVCKVLHCVSVAILFFISCHSGQSLLSESLKIPISAYESKWYLVSKPLQKELLVLIVRSQEDLLLEAAPIGTMHYDFFITVLKTSYSYFTFLHQMM